jgi:uncharacterized membrane protein
MAINAAIINNSPHKTKFEFVSCHRIPHRSFFFRGKQFPVCARCTGIYTAYLTLPVFTFDWWSPGIIISALLLLPALSDGLTQAYFNRESNNTLRFITGLLAGSGLMSLTAILGKFIGGLILTIIKQ